MSSVGHRGEKGPPGQNFGWRKYLDRGEALSLLARSLDNLELEWDVIMRGPYGDPSLFLKLEVPGFGVLIIDPQQVEYIFDKEGITDQVIKNIGIDYREKYEALVDFCRGEGFRVPKDLGEGSEPK